MAFTTIFRYLNHKTKQSVVSNLKTKSNVWIQRFNALTVCVLLFGTIIVVKLGKRRITEDGLELEDEFSNKPILVQYLLRTKNELAFYHELLKEPNREKLLPDLEKFTDSPQYTVVLEYTDVIVHANWSFQTGWRYKKRPGIENFLEELHGFYEIVIYTAEQGADVFPVLEAIDTKNFISYKLVKDATSFIGGEYIKDLDKLNRDLKKTIVIDWDADSTKYHPENVFLVPRWFGKDNDSMLMHLGQFLKAISKNNVDDVREVVTYYNQFKDPLNVFREKQRKVIDMAEIAASSTKEEKIKSTPINSKE